MAVIYGTIGPDTRSGTPENDTVYGQGMAMIIVCPVTTSCNKLVTTSCMAAQVTITWWQHWNDYINGGIGNDKLAGGAGNDIYVVGSTSDIISENPNEGNWYSQFLRQLTLGTT